MKPTNEELRKEIRDGLVYGLVAGLFGGLVTQITAYFTNNPNFSQMDLIISFILLIIVQIIGWLYVSKLNKEMRK